MSKGYKVTVIIFLVILIDQFLKFWVKLNLEYGEEFNILGLSWARIHFVENNGMAFGMSLGGEMGKLLLSIFRILAVSALGYYITLLIKAKESSKVLISFALILAGAIGNIIDSISYGEIFSRSSFHGGLAQLFPEGGGYSSLMHGKVVDMLYFPIGKVKMPSWSPFWSDEILHFFKPVFNIADTAITLGVIGVILFSKKHLKSAEVKDEQIIEEEKI